MEEIFEIYESKINGNEKFVYYESRMNIILDEIK